MTAQEISDRISQLTDGLLFPSESEYPLEPLVWKSATLTPETMLTRSQFVTDSDQISENTCNFNNFGRRSG